MVFREVGGVALRRVVFREVVVKGVAFMKERNT